MTRTAVSQVIHTHHQEISKRLSNEATRLRERRTDADGAALVEFLKTELLPHAEGEEHYLYPALDPVIKEYGQPTATMRMDHEFIQRYVARIEEAASKLTATTSAAERAERHEHLYRLTCGLEALLEVHLAKEERIYLPLFERHVPEREQALILDGMHESPEPTGKTPERVLDLRDLPRPQRYVRVFALFETLQAGEGFVLVNDHDPQALHHQLDREYSGQTTWEYLERGPEDWHVRIRKVR